MEHRSSLRRAQDEALDPERQAQAEGCSGIGFFLGCFVSMFIYYSKSRGNGGAAICATDLTGWHFVNAWVSLVGCLTPLALMVLGICGNDHCKAFMSSISRLIVTGINIFVFVWFIIGNQRLWKTHACDADDPGLQSPETSCCVAGLWIATHGWFVFLYVCIGFVFCLCCCWCAVAGFAVTKGDVAVTVKSGEETHLNP